MQYLEIALLTFLVLCSILTIFTRKLLSAVILFSGFSLILSILWLFMESPDLGITEAAVGAGITSILFFIVLRNINAMHLHDEESDLPEMIAKNVHGWYTGNDEDVDLIAEKEEIRESVEGLKTPLTTKKALFRNNILSIAVSVAIVIIMLAIVKDMPKYQIIQQNNLYYNGITWTKAHYLSPISFEKSSLLWKSGKIRFFC